METIKIIKIGGHVIDDAKAMDEFLYKFSLISGKKILVHGGGKVADGYLDKLNITIQRVNGRRITDQSTLDVVVSTYSGLINKSIVAKLQSLKCNAMGISGCDGGLIQAVKRPLKDSIDYGFVGDIKSINTDFIKNMLSHLDVLVVAPIASDSEGQLLNINADTIAAQLAVYLVNDFCVQLHYCFELDGVFKNISDDKTIFQQLDILTIQENIQNGNFSGGILPKLENCMFAVNSRVKLVQICNYKKVGEVWGTQISL
ncbi:acetylglutamate kinase [Dolichospermum sp. ST_sed1]|nr:acetylglutamate kinase [Dolichospermum sp. ST_sed1]